jgi:hypothetical protein
MRSTLTEPSIDNDGEIAGWSRPARSTGRGSGDRPVNRRLLLLGGLFLIGLAVGWLITRPFAGGTPPTVSHVEYTAVVAQLYQRDHNLTLAQERLSPFGSPDGLVQQASQAAQAGTLKDPNDAAAIQALAQALAGPNPSVATPVATPAIVTTPLAAASIARTTSGNATDAAVPPSPAGHPSWLGPLVAFLLALGLGLVVLLRTAGFSLTAVPRLRLAGSAFTPRMTPVPPPAGGRRSSAPRIPTVPERRGAASAPLAYPDDDFEIPPPVRPMGRPASRTPAPRPAPPGGGLVFQSSYRAGDDPYDEIHPITEPVSGGLVAACGLCAALKHEGYGSPAYYAFSAWVQDYLGSEQLQAVGLVAPAALASAQDQIDGWMRGGQIDRLLAVQRGTATEMVTDRLAVTVTVEDLEQDPATATFLRLSVRFDVRSKTEV